MMMMSCGRVTERSVRAGLIRLVASAWKTVDPTAERNSLSFFNIKVGDFRRSNPG